MWILSLKNEARAVVPENPVYFPLDILVVTPQNAHYLVSGGLKGIAEKRQVRRKVQTGCELPSTML